ncbi:DUF3325 family protein [Stenotrophomonas sp. CW117]|uniref:DUF3325 family protein n=2 Tax=Stenotrophomonas acidaminiphila TaxID=128780 RepID=UPI000B228A31|nr:DUF3325 family protein [Stenotrophomonas sp. CW117]
MASCSINREWRGLGWAMLVLGAGPCAHAQGWAAGPVMGLGALTVAGLLLALALHPCRPRRVVPLAWTPPPAGLRVARG